MGRDHALFLQLSFIYWIKFNFKIIKFNFKIIKLNFKIIKLNFIILKIIYFSDFFSCYNIYMSEQQYLLDLNNLFSTLSTKNNKDRLDLFSIYLNDILKKYPKFGDYLIDINTINSKIIKKSEKSEKYTILMFICIHGYNDIIEYLLKIRDSYGILRSHMEMNLNIQNNTGKTALMIASINNNFEIVQKLFIKGALLNIKDNLNNTAFSYAVENNCIDIIIYLFIHYFDDTYHSTCGYKNLKNLNCHKKSDSFFSRRFESSVLKNIIKNNNGILDTTNINDKISYDDTVLIRACEYGYLDIVEFLCDKGANINLVNKFGMSALMYACQKDNINIVKILCQKGANLDLLDINKKSALMFTCKKDHININIAKILYENVAYFDLLDIKGNSELLYLKNYNYNDFKKFRDEFFMNRLNDFNKFELYLIKNNELNNKLNKNKINKMNISHISFEYLINYVYDFINSIDENDFINSIDKNKINKYKEINDIFITFIFSFITNNYYLNNKDNLIAGDIYKLQKIIVDKSGLHTELYIIINRIRLISHAKNINLNKRFSVKYNKNGLNYGGLVKTFFSNIQVSLNNLYKIKKIENNINKTKIELIEYKNNIIKNYEDLQKKLNNLKKTSPSSIMNIKMVEQKISTTSNIYRFYKNNLMEKKEKNIIGVKINDILVNYRKKILSLKLSLNKINMDDEIKSINDKEKLKLLKISKINKNPLYLPDNILKNNILNIILSKYDSKYKKIIRKLLNYKIDEHFVKNLIEKDDDNIPINIDLSNLLDTEILNDNVYENIIDFFISHFINIKLNIDSIINKLEFSYHEISIKEQNFFKGIFIKLLKELNEEELIIFNKFISGSCIEQDKYVINIFKDEMLPSIWVSNKNNSKRYIQCKIVQHTCFQRLDIYNYLLFLKNYVYINKIEGKKIEQADIIINKKRFVKYMENYVNSGFTIA